MNFLGIGTGELLLILVIALLVLGPERLPEVVRQFVAIVRDIRAITDPIVRDLSKQFDLDELTRPLPSRPQPTPPVKPPALATKADDEELPNTIAPPALSQNAELSSSPPPSIEAPAEPSDER